MLKTAFPTRIAADLIFPDIDVDAARDDAERLFLGTIADIDRMVQEGSWYAVIRAAGLLWQLLLDQRPLLHEVNRLYKKRVCFDIHNYDRKMRMPPPALEWIDLDPSSFPDRDIMTVSLDEFLNAPCLVYDGVKASVQDVISACANVRGGRHFGTLQEVRKIHRQSIIDLDGAVRMFGKEPSQLMVAGICRVSLRGLQPLVNAVMGTSV